MITTPAVRTGNALLDSLPQEQWSDWRPLFQPVRMQAGRHVVFAGDSSAFLSFPTSGVYCQTLETGEGASIDVAAIGREGVIGLPALFGIPSPVECKVLSGPATALLIEVGVFNEHARKSGDLSRRLMFYAGARLAALAQVAACNRLHTAEQRFCRWLLAISARAQSPRIILTQELISLMLGTRRASVTELVGNLTERGLVRHWRGGIEILAPDALRQCSCECFAVIEQLYQRASTDPL